MQNQGMFGQNIDPLMLMGLSIMANKGDVGRGALQGLQLNQQFRGSNQNITNAKQQNAFVAMQMEGIKRKQQQAQQQQAAQQRISGMMRSRGTNVAPYTPGGQPGGMLDVMQAYPDIASKMMEQKLLPKPARKMMNVAPGGTVFDPNTQQPVFNAPFAPQKPDNTLVQVYDPTSPTGSKYVPRSEAAGMPGKMGSSMSLEVNPDGTISFQQGTGMERKTKTKAEGKISSILSNLTSLDALAKDYSDYALTYKGQAEGFATRQIRKSGFDAPDEWEKNLSKKTKFVTGIGQFFNSYRKEITGAAASVKELDRLLKTMINPDMSDIEFGAAYDQFVNLSKSQLELQRDLLSQGVTGKLLADALNKDFSLLEASKNGQPDKAGSQPSGMSDEELMKALGL